MDETEQEQLMDEVKSIVAKLGEHFDAVQVFASKHDAEEDDTLAFQYGAGNFFARFGQVSLWVEGHKEGGE